MLRNSREGWGRMSQLLHWLVALLILAQIPLGLAAVGWHLSPTKLSLFVWHKSIGMLVLVRWTPLSRQLPTGNKI
jgi:cytochrome b561